MNNFPSCFRRGPGVVNPRMPDHLVAAPSRADSEALRPCGRSPAHSALQPPDRAGSYGCHAALALSRHGDRGGFYAGQPDKSYAASCVKRACAATPGYPNSTSLL